MNNVCISINLPIMNQETDPGLDKVKMKKFIFHSLILSFSLLAFASSSVVKPELTDLPQISRTDSGSITAVGVVGHMLNTMLSLNCPLFNRPQSILQLELFSLLLIAQYYYIKLAHSYRMPFVLSLGVSSIAAVLGFIYGLVASGQVGESLVTAVINWLVIMVVGIFGGSAEWNRWIVVLAACLIGSKLASIYG